MSTELSQYKFGNIAEIAKFSVVGIKGYDPNIDLRKRIEEAGKFGKEDLGFSAFTYLFARLGTTNAGCEIAENIARYLIQTPIKDLVLVVNIGTTIELEIVGDKDLAQKYLEAYCKPVQEWRKSFEEWAFEQGFVVYDASVGRLNREELQFYADFLEKDVDFWVENANTKEFAAEAKRRREAEEIAHKEGKESTPIFSQKEVDAFFEWKATQVKEWKDKYLETHPFPIPSGTFQEVLEWHEKAHEEGVMNYVYQAVNQTLDELMKPVMVGTCFVNLLGAMEYIWNEKNVEDAQNRLWKFAGNGFIENEITDYDKWIEVVSLARDIGGGDLQLGFEKALQPFLNARTRKPKKAKIKGKLAK